MQEKKTWRNNFLKWLDYIVSFLSVTQWKCEIPQTLPSKLWQHSEKSSVNIYQCISDNLFIFSVQAIQKMEDDKTVHRTWGYKDDITWSLWSIQPVQQKEQIQHNLHPTTDLLNQNKQPKCEMPNRSDPTQWHFSQGHQDCNYHVIKIIVQ